MSFGSEAPSKPFKQGLLQLLAYEDGQSAEGHPLAQRWVDCTLSTFLSPPSFTLDGPAAICNSSVHIPVSAVGDDVGFQGSAAASSFRVESRSGCWHFRVPDSDSFAAWLSVFQALARSRLSSPSTKGVTVPHKLLLREAAVQINDGVSSLWSARWLVLKEYRLSCFDRPGSSAVLSVFDLSYAGKGFISMPSIDDAPTSFVILLSLPPESCSGRSIQLGLCFPSAALLSSWYTWLLNLEGLLFGYPLEKLIQETSASPMPKLVDPSLLMRSRGSTMAPARSGSGFGSGPSALRRRSMAPTMSQSPVAAPPLRAAGSVSSTVALFEASAASSASDPRRMYQSNAAKFLAKAKRPAPRLLKQQNDAATKIQKMYRGMKGRRLASRVRAEKLKREEQLKRAREFAERSRGVAAVKARIQREIEEQRERERAVEEQRRAGMGALMGTPSSAMSTGRRKIASLRRQASARNAAAALSPASASPGNVRATPSPHALHVDTLEMPASDSMSPPAFVIPLLPVSAVDVNDADANVTPREATGFPVGHIPSASHDADPSLPAIDNVTHHHRNSSSDVQFDDNIQVESTGGTTRTPSAASPPAASVGLTDVVLEPSTAASAAEPASMEVDTYADSDDEPPDENECASMIQDYWRKWHSNRRAQRLREDIEALGAQEAALHADAALKIQCMIRQHAAKKQLELARQARHDAILARVRARAAPAVAQTPVVPPPTRRKCCSVL